MKETRLNKLNSLRTTSTTITTVALVLTIFAVSFDSQAQAQLTRPRMLIGERDPLTGLNILRARYAAGARPVDDIDGWALSYLLTRDESFAKRAIERMRTTHPPELVSSRTYPEYVKWSLAFDWMYNHKDFDDPLKLY